MAKKKYIADLHIHSRYSRATSKASNLHGLAAWAAIKGIDVVGTGDFTHPGWFAHLTRHLEPAEPGFFRLKEPPDFAELLPILPPNVQPDTSGIRFVLSSEISSIYKRGGKVRKIHNILYAPDFEAVRRINSTLAGIGNLEADGRPILGLDSEILLEILLEHAPRGFLVPAHIWTPWFSLFGSKSGFDAIEECYGDLSKHIFALETGLSSDPEMNRCISALDRFSLISNSDCHSPSKLGREANIFTTGFDYLAMQEAIRNPVDQQGQQQFAATIEFFPEEGKYHCDGHRKCGVCLEPARTVEENGLCPHCHRPLTIGVLYRVMQLADRTTPVYADGEPAVHSLIPLPEMLGELFNVGPASKKVASVYGNLINTFGSEFKLLLETPISDIETASPMLARAVARVRENRVIRTPGFDGEFGVIRVFTDEERAGLGGQLSLFGVTPAKPRKKKGRKKPVFLSQKKESNQGWQDRNRCNPAQQAAVDSEAKTIVVQAGPGTGKTHTLVQRVKRLLASGQQPITVITFTNRAAAEIRQRLDLAATDRQQSDPVQVDTFHGFCLSWLRRRNPVLSLAGPEMRKQIFYQLYPRLSSRERHRLQQETGLFLANQTRLPDQPPAVDPETSCYGDYYRYLRDHELLDLDEVVPACTALLADDPAFAEAVRAATRHLLVDEFQDLNAGQYQLVWQLAETSAVFAIGDPDQAIYGFRGATPAWFYRFVDEQQSELHYLTTNYRSRAVILQAAARVIANNQGTEQEEKRRETCAVTEKPGMIFLERPTDSRQEALFVADQVQQLLGGTSHREIDRLDGKFGKGLALSDIGILYRTAHQAQAIADALAERTIPCQLVNLEPFYQAGDARIIYYWLLLAAARIDPAELRFLFAGEQGLGAQSLGVLEQLLLDREKGVLPMDQLIARKSDLPGRVQKKVEEFVAMAERLLAAAEEKSVTAAIELLISHYEMDGENPDLVRLLDLAGSAVSLPLFSDHLRKYQDSVVYDERAESVLLATLHAAKGLEFKAVFLIGCEEGLLPMLPRNNEPDTIDEERRLFYVGMTRAAEMLYLSAVRERKGYRGMEQQVSSRFLAEIPAELLSSVSKKSRKKGGRKSTARQLRLF